jgi:dUTP pyrophosphatase
MNGKIKFIELEFNSAMYPLMSKVGDASGFDVKAINIKQIWNNKNKKLERSETEKLNKVFQDKGELYLKPSSRTLIGIGLKFDLPDGIHCLVHSRSSVPLKQGLIIGNSPGVIDTDYRGEVGIILINTSDLPVIIKRGQRIAQLIFEEKSNFHLIRVEEFDTHTSLRGEKGFGSSGV